ncbi:hypothetical protein [Neiella marina]|nr:hypothetical protein [Neiella marina]
MEIIIASAAALIALCSLFVAVWQGYVSRKHARLSVMPHLDLHIAVSEQAPFIGLSLENNGLGTARIRDIKISKLTNNEATIVVDNNSGWHDLLNAFDIKQTGVSWASISTDEAIPSGNEHHFLSIDKTSTELSDLKDKLRAMVDQMLIRVEYESLYSERKTLEWQRTKS